VWDIICIAVLYNSSKLSSTVDVPQANLIWGDFLSKPRFAHIQVTVHYGALGGHKRLVCHDGFMGSQEIISLRFINHANTTG
jgi:hypothetical protein